MEHVIPSNDDTVIQEMIRTSMQRISRDKRRITKKHLLKILFLARERLHDGNPIRRLLAYYWYLEGPYSEVIDNNLTLLVRSGRIKKYKTDKSETYKLVSKYALRPMVRHDADIDEAVREIRTVVDEVPDRHGAVARAYEIAPYRWYKTYGLEFRPKFESHCKDLLAGRESRYADEKILDMLDDAVLDYPSGRAFIHHRMIFMDFAKMLNSFLRWDSYRTSNDMMKTLLELSDEIWDVFARMARIHNHDEYYDDRVAGWKAAYKQKSDVLNGVILKRMKEFDAVVVDETRLAPHIEGVLLHPERHTFTPLVPHAVAETRQCS